MDRRFVGCRCTASDRSAAIVRATVELGHALGLEVVAEGVEDEGTWEALLAVGCDQAQGYHLCRPVPADKLLDWLAQRDQDGPAMAAPAGGGGVTA